MQSPSTARGSRRQTGDSYPFPNSVTSPTVREEQRAPSPPASLLRRRTDLKDVGKSEDAAGEEKGATTPSGVKRNPIGPLGGAGFGVPTSPWANGPQSAGFSPMGSFGNFGLGGSGQGTPGEKRAGLGSGRAESRFKNLLSKDSNEDIGAKALEHKTSISNLPKVNENESWRPQDRNDAPGALTEEPDEDDGPSGSAALAAGSDLSPPNTHQGLRGFDTPSRSNTRDRDFGFGAFGMTTDNAGGFGSGFLQSANQQTPGRPGISAANDPQSPTDTNPYKSPEQHGGEQLRESLDDTPDIPSAPLPGLGYGGDAMHQGGGLSGLGGLPNLGRHVGGQGPASDDRSQTSSVGPNRGFTGLGGLGQFGGPSAWPTSQPGLGTPGRQTVGLSNAFGGGMLGNSLGDMQSPNLAGLGGGSAMSPHVGSGFGGSRMASMFPQGMQDQMRQGDQHEERPGQAQFAGLGGLDVDNPFQGQGFGGQHDGDQFLQEQMAGQHQPPGSSASNQPPPPQQRTMVMPDRMRWIYRDPQGQTQGPWSGLEMHDWYKAGFFSPELLVKKAEDADYEPLAQLIRRIGNSREPFLVPQIGIPHGQNTASPPGPWAAAAPPAAAAPTGGAQPPFASSFPSFGTTLTADQQNALERRKQEEQYLMARQKEHLAQAQIAHRMQHIQGPHPGFAPGAASQGGQLHRHSSAQSLHSQPSFGSITSPGAFQASPTQPPAAGAPTGFFDNSFRNPQAGLGAVGAGVDSLGHIAEEEIPSIMNRLNLGTRSGQPNQFGAPGQPFSQQQQSQDAHAQQVQQMLQDRARLNEEQARQDAAEQDQPEQQAPNERLQEFQQLQEQDKAQAAAEKQQTQEQPSQAAESTTTESSVGSPVPTQAEQVQTKEPLTLTEQVQKAASAKQSPAPVQQAWAKVDTGIPQPFPPAPSQSPLPAPAAQRTSRQTVAEHLNAESRSRSQTPSVETPTTVAPWAKEPAGPPKGPSLREIQEAEAKKAAEQEELAAAARRAALQKELELQTAAAAAAPPAPGLPSSSTWAATSASPVSSGTSAWAKAAQPKPASTAAKSMAQIQKEEEARKRRVAAAAAQAQAVAMASVPSPAGGKSYANLAGKVMPPSAQASATPGSSAWTTVGAGGKTKLPAAPSPAPAARVPSASMMPAVQPMMSAAVKKAPSRSATLTGSGAVNAQEEFRKWAINELRPDLNPGLTGKYLSPESHLKTRHKLTQPLTAEQFVADLIFFPAEAELITEAVHGSSSTIDSRHFAEEFIRRKRLADKGLVDTSTPPKSGSPANAAPGGWSEVAKKGPAKPETPKEDPANGNFRVVPSKKKGGKK